MNPVQNDNIYIIFASLMRYFIEIAYNGAKFHGWQVQPNAITVQETLTHALSTILRDKSIHLIGCGRTDTGVHASQFFAHFDTETKIEDCEKLIFKLNSFLKTNIACYRCFEVFNDFHARFDATSRTYRYFIHNRKNPFIDELSYFCNQDLDIDKMNKAAKLMFNYKDFTSFSKLHTDAKTNICTLYHAEWTENEKGFVFEIKANRFLRNMVRSIVGTLLDVGMNKISLKEFTDIIESEDRSEAGTSVPGKGLFLTKIEYPYINE